MMNDIVRIYKGNVFSLSYIKSHIACCGNTFV